MAFMGHYQRLRGKCQEVDYNLGRMFHQIGMLPQAIYFYERVLNEMATPRVFRDDYDPTPENDEDLEEGDEALNAEEDTGSDGLCGMRYRPYKPHYAQRYDLKRYAAHNLSSIYVQSGNRMLAHEILEQYCSV